jgi:N-acetylmuramate 1-kinase
MLIKSTSPEDTENFARMLSLWARPGYVILLKGDLGSGKSTFARAFIQSMGTEGTNFDVPSPTFSLVQTYDNTRVPASHIDLYRLKSPSEAHELGLNDLVATHILLIEWPNEEQEQLSPNTLTLSFTGEGENRIIDLEAQGAWANALKRNSEIEALLHKQKFEPYVRQFLDGDASSRRYEKINAASKTSILMDMPQRPDGPPVKDGKPYSAIAHLAEGLHAVVAINDHLFAMGYSAPQIYDCDLKTGLALIEDLGPHVYGNIMRAGLDMHEPMRAATLLLANMATKSWPDRLKNRDGSTYVMPHYDLAAQLIEIDLLPSWFHPHIHGAPTPAEWHESFEHEWRKILPLAVQAKPQWVLRDFHSPNLIWIAERKSLKRVGLIDTQDALMGHGAYDLASMLQDARVDIPFDLADALYAEYVFARKQEGHFNEEEFAAAYAILGAQRATKILGIFARLNKRDGKPQYLKHMPRMSRYLKRNLQHPALASLRQWINTHVPEALTQ